MRVSDSECERERECESESKSVSESERETERECKIPLYNLDSQSYQVMRSILNPLNSHSSLPLCDQAVVQSGLGQS